MQGNTESSTTGFFSYKGLPLVRCDDTIYYGNMSDEYVIMIKVLGTKKVGDLNVADKVRVQMIATDPTVDATTRIVKTIERSGLYEALDISQIWLSRVQGE